MAKSQPTTIALGKNKGHKTTKIQAKRTRPVSTKAKIGKRTKLVRQVIGQVAGICGYEKRAIEFLKAGSLKDTKRALKLTKKALGTHRRAKLKRENLMNLLREQAKKK
jgi:large subunit ribosomal protein L36e